MISLQHISKKYQGSEPDGKSGVALWLRNFVNLTANRAQATLALDDVSLSVEKGEIFGIYGANGSGKTTLIKILSGLLLPTSGHLAVAGYSENQQIKNQVSYISTNGWMGLEWQLTARENLLLYGSIFAIPHKILASRCDKVLQQLGMVEAQNKYVSQLSAGMRQKITIARGLILQRPIIFYDEPSVSLDVPSAISLRALMQNDVKENQRTVLIASHNDEDLAICGRIALLAQGRILAVGTLKQLGQPLADREIIEISYSDQGPRIDFTKFEGIISVTDSVRESSRQQRVCKINVKKTGFSLDRLIDFLVKNEIFVTNLRCLDISLPEIYAYYVGQPGGDELALV